MREEERKRREEERKRREEERRREEIKRWLVDFNISDDAGRRLLYDYRRIKDSNPDKSGFTVVPINFNIFHWQIKIFKFDEKSEMYEDLQKYKQITNRDYVEMEFFFHQTILFFHHLFVSFNHVLPFIQNLLQ